MNMHDEVLGSIPELPDWDPVRKAEIRQHVLSHVHGTKRRHSRQRLAIASATISAIALVTISVTANEPAVAAVTFQETDDNIVATVTDPFEDSNLLNQTFREAGLNISVDLVPGSPSRVGSIVSIQHTSEQDLLPLVEGPCLNADCPIGIIIPHDYEGQATITFARPAVSGEAFIATTSAFDPGEPLASLDLVGQPANDAHQAMIAAGIEVDWRTTVGSNQTLSADQLDGLALLSATSATANSVIAWAG